MRERERPSISGMPSTAPTAVARDAPPLASLLLAAWSMPFAAGGCGGRVVAGSLVACSLARRPFALEMKAICAGDEIAHLRPEARGKDDRIVWKVRLRLCPVDGGGAAACTMFSFPPASPVASTMPRESATPQTEG